MNPPFCEICEEPFYNNTEYLDCIICGQHCCKKCIDDEWKICVDCDTLKTKSVKIPRPKNK